MGGQREEGRRHAHAIRQSSAQVRRTREEWPEAEEDLRAVIRLGTGSDRITGWAASPSSHIGATTAARPTQSSLARSPLPTRSIPACTTRRISHGPSADRTTWTRSHLLERFDPRFDAHFHLHLQFDPMLDPLRQEPRFGDSSVERTSRDDHARRMRHGAPPEPPRASHGATFRRRRGSG